LFYIFIRKYRFNLRPRLLGWRNFIFVVLYWVFMQLILPFMIVGYTLVLFWLLPVGIVLGLLGFIYICYFAALLFYFFLYLVAISERPAQISTSC